MALTRRALAAVLAGCALTAATVSPALAYWKAAGRGTGTVPTANAAVNALTIALTGVTGKAVKVSGKAGSGLPYAGSVTVTLCQVSTVPCPTGSTAFTISTAVTAGNYSATSGNLNNAGALWGQVDQLQSSGWRDNAVSAGTITP